MFSSNYSGWKCEIHKRTWWSTITFSLCRIWYYHLPIFSWSCSPSASKFSLSLSLSLSPHLEAKVLMDSKSANVSWLIFSSFCYLKNVAQGFKIWSCSNCSNLHWYYIQVTCFFFFSIEKYITQLSFLLNSLEKENSMPLYNDWTGTL